MNFDLNKLVRDNIKNLKPYSSARSEFTGHASVYLDANENAYGSPVADNYNRYPDPLQWKLKCQLSEIKGIPAGNICFGNGSDEIIDLAYRIFCDPGKDNVIICPPTYGMYEVSACIHDVQIRKVGLTENFQLDVNGIINATDSNTKLLFICSPNNPTGNDINRPDIEALLNNFPGTVIIDEAYINYSAQKTLLNDLRKYPNLLVMQTLSKAWGLASLRIGICYASIEIINLFNKIKPPYNINGASQQIALAALQHSVKINTWVKEVVLQREKLAAALREFTFLKTIYPSHSNFILVKAEDADALYLFLTAKQIAVRNRSKEPGCENCLRISIGTPAENSMLVTALKEYRA